MHAEDLVGGISATVRDDKMHLVLADQYGLFRFVAGVMPARLLQGDEEVLGMLAWLPPVEAGRTRKHDVREIKFAVHSCCVACIEVGSESFQAF